MSSPQPHPVAAEPAIPGRARRARSDWRAAIDAGLPVSLASLVRRIVLRSGLWRSEKADMARELSTHFADGLAAGRTPEELTMDFGDPDRAARLMRRAKKRNRPWRYRAFVHTAQGIGAIFLALLLAYVALAWRYYTAEPVIKRNYVAEYNTAIGQIPENERAYDLYIRAWEQLPRRPDSLLNAWPAFAPDHPAYADAIDYLERAAPAMELLHQAAARPSLGAPMSDAMDPRLVKIFQSRNEHFRPEPAEPSANPPLVTILLPALAEFRGNAQLLALDAHEAARRDDAQRTLRDLASLYGIAEHPAQQPTLIGQLVGLAIYALATQTASQIVHEYPDLFTDEQLRDLAHRTAAFMGGQPRIDLSPERRYFEDVIQRTYSDDGDGNGHITAAGMRNLTTYFQAGQPAAPVLSSPLGPIASAVVADRADMTARFDAMMTRLERDAELPLWRYDERSDTEATIEAMHDDPLERARYLPITILMPALSNAPLSAEQAAQRRDALLTGIALELYKRARGEYPESLDALVPAHLPSAAIDRFTGEPLSYELRAGTPHLWSVGADRKNDDGRAPPADKDMTSRWIPAGSIAARLADPLAGPCYDGDWVLWPAEYEPLSRDP